jgi:hypothetical protein
LRIRYSIPNVVGNANTRAVLAPIAVYGISEVIASNAGTTSGKCIEL